MEVFSAKIVGVLNITTKSHDRQHLLNTNEVNNHIPVKCSPTKIKVNPLHYHIEQRAEHPRPTLIIPQMEMHSNSISTRYSF